MSIINSVLSLNWFAVVFCWFFHIVFSLAWYTPIFFGRAWVKLSGREMEPAKQWIPVGFLAHLICIIALAIIIQLANAKTLLEGVVLGLVVSIGFIGAMLAGELVWEKIPFQLFLIRLGDQVLTLSIAGAILAMWS